jgi:hypothetical protein
MSTSGTNWAAVSQFISDMRNASRLATYVDSVVAIFQSGSWRSYTDATGNADEWRPCEFDYFMIACGANYSDVQRILSWEKARAVELAAAMHSDDPRARRSLAEASAAWRSPTSASLIELAERQGWMTPSGKCRVAPIPERARARARHGVSMDEHARQVRESQLTPKRRRQLDRLTAAVIDGDVTPIELRYVIDRLRDSVRSRSRQPRHPRVAREGMNHNGR